MMPRLRTIADNSGAAAAEMALAIPLLLTIMLGSVELGNFFYNEHILVKAVRDGARYAARQSFTYYSACSGSPTGNVVTETRELVRTSLLSSGSDRLANIDPERIAVTTSCSTSATDMSNSVEAMTGIYNDFALGAPIVRVSANVDYTPVIGAMFGFSGIGLDLNANQEAAVMGL